jgi:hypothetical protein
LFTAANNSSMVISPSTFASPAEHADTGALPRAMFTIVMSSFTVTSSPPPQVPTQGVGVRVRVGVEVPVGVDVGVGVSVGPLLLTTTTAPLLIEPEISSPAGSLKCTPLRVSGYEPSAALAPTLTLQV